MRTGETDENKGLFAGVDKNGSMLREHRLEVALVVAIVLVTALGVRASYQPQDPIGQVEVVESLYDLDLDDPHPWFTAWTLGDGQAYALIAADVSGQKLATHVQEAAYRFARAGHGWAAAAFSLGRESLIPYGLATTGALALVGVVAVAMRLRSRLGPRVWWVVFNPALYLGFAGDTSEPLAVLLLMIAMAWSSWVAAMLLGVSRPTFLVSTWGNWRLFVPGASTAVVLAVYSLIAFGSDSFVPDGGRLGLPLSAYVEHPSISGIALGVAAIATVVVGVRLRDWSWVIAGLFIFCFGSDVLRDPVNAWRAAGFLPVMWAFGPRWDVSRTTATRDPSHETVAGNVST